MPNVWRVRMKSGAPGVDHVAARRFAITHGIVGAGWGLNGSSQENQIPDGCSDIREYLRHAKTVFPNDKSLIKAASIYGHKMQIGDICWMYLSNTKEYWCCRIDSKFEYRSGSDFDLYDLHITRRCTWELAGSKDSAPDVVLRAFKGPFGTVSAITTDAHVALVAADLVLGSKGSS